MTSPNSFARVVQRFYADHPEVSELLIADVIPGRRVFDLAVLYRLYDTFQRVLMTADLPAQIVPPQDAEEHVVFERLVDSSPVDADTFRAWRSTLDTSITASVTRAERVLFPKFWHQRYAEIPETKQTPTRLVAFVHVLIAVLQTAGTNVLYETIVNRAIPPKGTLPPASPAGVFNPNATHPWRFALLQAAAEQLFTVSMQYDYRLPLRGPVAYAQFANAVDMSAGQLAALQRAADPILASALGRIGIGLNRVRPGTASHRAYFALLHRVNQRLEG